MLEMTEKTAKNPSSAPPDGFETARKAIFAQALSAAAFEGWTEMSLKQAASAAGYDSAMVAASFPRGVADLLQYWSAKLDQGMAEAMRGDDFAILKIREKVAFAVTARLDLMRLHKEAARRAAAQLALPGMGLLGAQLAWRTADAIWRGLNDSSTDFNFYSKRAILTGVWTSTLMRWFADDSADGAETQRFLAARIDNVMQIEKAKAQMRKSGVDLAAPIGWLAKLRYPGRDAGAA